jgi:GNAT superfamily N-acetyltransferase
LKSNKMQYVIRPYQKDDRHSVRRISCETAFLENDLHNFFSDEEVLADSLTLYFTDYEPESCFVADSDKQAVGYLIGSKDVHRMEKIFNSKVLPPLLVKAWHKKIFFNRTNLRFFLYVLRSGIKGEFFMPDFSRDFPATLHINLDRNFRGQGAGGALVDRYLDYLRKNQVSGVHLGTFSETAKNFFVREGFQELFRSKRTYLKPYIGKEINFYVFGRKL